MDRASGNQSKASEGPQRPYGEAGTARNGPAGLPGNSKSAPSGGVEINFSGVWTADVNYGTNWLPPNKIYHETFRFVIVGDEVTGSASRSVLKVCSLTI